MGFEVDILEREESYKRRLNRMLTLIGIAVLVAVGTGFYLLDRQEKNLAKAEAHAEEMRVQAEIAARRAAYSADSASAYNRLAAFMDKYRAEKAQGSPLFLISLPANRTVPNFLDEVWSEYADVVEPGLTESGKRDLFRLNYVDAMNMAWYNESGRLAWQGEHRPTAILVPEMKFKLTRVEIQKTTFPQVARAQLDAGIKVLETDDSDIDATPAVTDSTEVENVGESLGETAAAP